MVMDWNRRQFLRAGALLGAATALPSALRGPASQPVTPAEFKQRLRGPIVSIPTPFTPDFRLDGPGLRQMIEMDLRNQIVIFELTAGDSQYSFLAYDEIKQLARMVACRLSAPARGGLNKPSISPATLNRWGAPLCRC